MDWKALIREFYLAQKHDDDRRCALVGDHGRTDEIAFYDQHAEAGLRKRYHDHRGNCSTEHFVPESEEIHAIEETPERVLAEVRHEGLFENLAFDLRRSCAEWSVENIYRRCLYCESRPGVCSTCEGDGKCYLCGGSGTDVIDAALHGDQWQRGLVRLISGVLRRGRSSEQPPTPSSAKHCEACGGDGYCDDCAGRKKCVNCAGSPVPGWIDYH